MKGTLFALALSLAPIVASADIVCTEDEQKGCFSIQGLTVVLDQDLPAFDFVDNRPEPGTAEYEKVVKNAAFDLYALAKTGRVAPAGWRDFSIFMWNVGDQPTSQMSEHRLGKKISAGTVAHSARETPVSWIGRFDPTFAEAHGLDGPPDRQFEVQSGGYAFSFVIPKDMIQEDTWIAICPWFGAAVYPDQRGDEREVIWLSPPVLQELLKRDGVFTPYVYGQSDWLYDVLN